MLYPKKNLIKPATSSDWTINPYATVLGPYHLKVNQPVQYQASVFNKLDLKPNTLYTLSCDGITENAQFYVKRMLNGVAAYHILKKGVEVLEFTAVAGATYTIEFHNGTVLGEGYVLNFQLEEGKKTPFAPYELANKKADMPKEVINSDMSGAASHVYPYGNIIQVKEDVRLYGYKIQVGTPTGTFDSVIYEWNNGSIGEPLFREVVNASTSGVMNLSYRGTLLKAGKKYYIGRNDPNRDNSSVGNAGVFRKTGMPPADFKYITTLGGSQFYSPAIDFPSTWYYIFALEIESQKNKPAQILPKKNLLDYSTIVKRAGTNNVTINGTRIEFDANNQDYAGFNLVTPDSWLSGKQVTWSVSERSAGCTPMLAYQKAGEQTLTYIGMAANENSKTVTIPQGATGMRFYVQNDANKRGNFYVKDFQAEIGGAATPYEPFKVMNKPLIFYPRKNLIPDFKDSRWFSDYTTAGGTMIVDPTDPYKMKFTMTASAQGRLIWIPVEAGKTYTFSYGKMDGLYRLYKRKVGNHDIAMVLTQHSVAGLPATYTFTVDADYQGFVTLRLTQGMAGTFSFEKLKLEEGPDKTPFQLYVNDMKPAVLYPQKNLLPPFSQWMYTNANGKVTFESDYKMIMAADVNTLYYNHHVTVEKGKTYTFSIGSISTNARVAIREVRADNSKTFKTNLTPDLKKYTLSPASDTVKIEFDCTVQTVGTLVFENPMIEEGPTATPFEPIKYGNKK